MSPMFLDIFIYFSYSVLQYPFLSKSASIPVFNRFFRIVSADYVLCCILFLRKYKTGHTKGASAQILLLRQSAAII